MMLKPAFFSASRPFLPTGINFLAFVGAEKVLGLAQNIRVERARQPALSRQNQRENTLLGAPGQQRVLWLSNARHDRTQHPRKFPGVGPSSQRGFLGPAQHGCGDKLHRARDLLGVLHRADAAPEIEKCGHRSSSGCASNSLPRLRQP